MKRGTLSLSLFLILGGIALIVLATLASVIFLPTADPNLGGIIGIGGVALGIVLLVIGVILRWTQRRG